MTIGKRIQELRKHRGFSQEQLAERLEVTRQSVSKWELDEAVPDIKFIIMMSELFSVSTDELLKGKKSESVETVKEKDNGMTLEGNGMSMKISKDGKMTMHMDGMPDMVMEPMQKRKPMGAMSFTEGNIMPSSDLSELGIELEEGAELLSQQQSSSNQVTTISLKYKVDGKICSRTIVKKDGKIITDIVE